MQRVDSRYTLCVLIGKRARQLLNGTHLLIECNSKKPVSIATNELCEGKFTYVRIKSGLKLRSVLGDTI